MQARIKMEEVVIKRYHMREKESLSNITWKEILKRR